MKCDCFFHMGGVFSLRLLMLPMPSYIAMGCWIEQPASVHLYHFELTWNLNQKSPHPRRNLTFFGLHYRQGRIIVIYWSHKNLIRDSMFLIFSSQMFRRSVKFNEIDKMGDNSLKQLSYFIHFFIDHQLVESSSMHHQRELRSKRPQI